MHLPMYKIKLTMVSYTRCVPSFYTRCSELCEKKKLMHKKLSIRLLQSYIVTSLLVLLLRSSPASRRTDKS